MPLLEDPSLRGLIIKRREAAITSDKGTTRGLCEVWLDFSQEPHVLIQLLASANAALPDMGSDHVEVIFDGATASTPCEIDAQRVSSGGEITTQFQPKRGVFFGRYGEAKSVVALLANFGDYRLKNRKLSFGDAIFQWDMAPLSDEERERFKPCETKSFRVTHSAVLQRKDGTYLRIDDIEEEVEKLRWFLSFCHGGWVSPLSLKGLDTMENVVFETWRNTLLSHYRPNSRSWLDSFHSSAIVDVWPGFVERWNDPLWKETIKLSFYWLLRGDSGQVGSDGGLILFQAAFERLAWHLFVIDEQSLTAAAFGKTNAAEKMRLLLTRLGIPNDVPTTSPELIQFATKDGLDGPGILTRLRNSLVHPAKRKATKHPYPQAYFLARHYLLLCLLGLFDYHGKYIDWTKLPRWNGEVQKVPWA